MSRTKQRAQHTTKTDKWEPYMSPCALNSTHRPTDSACHLSNLSAVSRLNNPSSSLIGSSVGSVMGAADTFVVLTGGVVVGAGPVFSLRSAPEVVENPVNLRFINAAVAVVVPLDEAAAAVEDADAAAADNWVTIRSKTDAFAL